ncbi:hypothetical protein P171DRAFT_480592 [Karstenula rhodostoma CBS 690.94]|uniref:Uncharacterized protein n=1 Tax=Karstenula rhodostoma CBS 690.94 TaxID=1392251 RepID=A0A9P4UHF3_9PLEO|nr:hypothetical protein P171DRAFT_480592 [Karstenula rhodostoma CBS 690.94]
MPMLLLTDSDPNPAHLDYNHEKRNGHENEDHGSHEDEDVDSEQDDHESVDQTGEDEDCHER